tara:strand:+ start:121 stop:936 length:816 start_codon:yes stop_codon:yes gene_type:complete
MCIFLTLLIEINFSKMFQKFITKLIFALQFTFAAAQVNTESMRNSFSDDSLKHALRLDLNLEKSSEEVFDASVNYRFDINIGENLTSFLVINYENGYEQLPENEKNIIKNKGFGHLRLTKNFSNNFYIEGFAQAGFNDFLLMERRSLYGLGVRNKLIDKKRTVLFSGVGFMSESETYNTGLEKDKNLLRSTNYLNANFSFSENIQFVNTVYFQLSTVEEKDYRLLFESILEYKLNNNLEFSFEINYRYDNQPHGDLGKNYYDVKNGITYRF